MTPALDESARDLVTTIANACSPAGNSALQEAEIAELTQRIVSLAQRHADDQTRKSLFNYALFAEGHE